MLNTKHVRMNQNNVISWTNDAIYNPSLTHISAGYRTAKPEADIST